MAVHVSGTLATTTHKTAMTLWHEDWVAGGRSLPAGQELHGAFMSISCCLAKPKHAEFRALHDAGAPAIVPGHLKLSLWIPASSQLQPELRGQAVPIVAPAHLLVDVTGCDREALVFCQSDIDLGKDLHRCLAPTVSDAGSQRDDCSGDVPLQAICPGEPAESQRLEAAAVPCEGRREEVDETFA